MHLDLSFNKIKTINLTPLVHCKDLKALHLYENKLESIDLSVLSKSKKLRNLTLKKNSLKSVDVSPLFLCPSLVKFGIDLDVTLTAASKLKTQAKVPIGLKPHLSRINWV
jgi:Leucine-rich repeat (LRR) protein